MGYVLLGVGEPIVVCAVDRPGWPIGAYSMEKGSGWMRLGPPSIELPFNVHQHNAPFACMDAQAIVQEQGDLPDIVNPYFSDRCLKNAGDAVTKSLKKTTP